MTLTEIANKYTCDKGTEHHEKHGYTEVYSKYIPNTGKYTLLEIGIWHGDSIKMWNEYNPELNIHAIDIDRNVLNFIQPSEQVKIYLGNQSDSSFMDKVISESGSPDFIVDDGSHNYQDIVNSFKMLYNKLADGGIYFIEDLHAPHAKVDQLRIWISNYFNSFNSGIKKPTSMEWACNNKLLIIKK